MSLMNGAFNLLIAMKGRIMTIERYPAIAPVDIKVANSNYFKNIGAQEEMIVEGFEFIIPKSELDRVSFGGPPQRGDTLNDPDLDANTISEIRPMIGLGGEILGYRVRTS